MPRPSRRITLAAVCAVLFAVAFAGVALAQSNDKLRAGETVTIPAGETVSTDLYVFAGTVRVEGTIDGDLVAVGGTIDVPGTVTGDILSTGGNVSINGTVGGDVRAAAGTVSVGGKVTEDLATAAGNVTLTPAGAVGEDMLASVGWLTVDGTVSGDLTATAARYDKRGTVGGAEDVVINAGRFPWGQPTPTPAPPTPAESVAARGLDALQHFVIVLIAGGLFLWLAPRAYAATKEAIQRRPLVAAGWGLLGLFGYLVALLVILLAMIVLATAFGIIGLDDLVGLDVLAGIVAILGTTLGFVVVSAYLADALVGAAIAGLVMRDGSAMSRGREFGLLAAGAAVVVVLSAIPVIGPWVKLVVILLGLGAVLVTAWTARRPATPPVPEPVLMNQ
jgi:cytoskeletal protein CcmA (bactofilin family)